MACRLHNNVELTEIAAQHYLSRSLTQLVIVLSLPTYMLRLRGGNDAKRLRKVVGEKGSLRYLAVVGWILFDSS